MSRFKKSVILATRIIEIIIAIISSIFSFWFYAKTYNLPCEHPISVWFLVWGIVVILVISIGRSKPLWGKHTKSKRLVPIWIFIVLLALFTIGWFIAGNVWIFSTKRGGQCDDFVREASFWYLIAAYIFNETLILIRWWARGCKCDCNDDAEMLQDPQEVV